MASSANVRLFRSILKELQNITHEGSVKASPAYSFIKDVFDQHSVTSQKLCRGEKEVQHLGETYLCLLESVRKQEELAALYKSKGEKSTEESAKLVGLKIPEKPE